MPQQHPNGTVQAISSAAMTMFALLIAYLGYTALKSSSPWRTIDLWTQIIPSVLAAISLAAVPWLSTKREDATSHSIDHARIAFAIGSALVLVAIFAPLVCDFVNNRAQQ